MLLVGKIIELANEWAVLVIEPALPGPVLTVGMSEVPFTDHRGVVPRILEHLRQEILVECEAVSGLARNHQSLQAITKGIAPGQECRARWCAHRLDIKLLEASTSCGEVIDVWRLDVGSVKTNIFPAEIIRQNVNYVRFGILCTKRLDDCDQRKCASNE